jgi:hypothetical protein
MTCTRPPELRRSPQARAFLLLLSLALLCLPSLPVGAQTSRKLVFESDKSKPNRKTEKLASEKARLEDAVTKQTSPTAADAQAAPAPPAANSEEEATAEALSCDLTTLLVLQDVRIAVVNLWNHPENSTIPVTLTQTSSGVVGYSLTPAGPFTPTLNILIQTDGAGNGQSADIYIQGLQVGVTTTYGQSPYGFTNTIDLTVLPQCNCPAIPVVP